MESLERLYKIVERQLDKAVDVLENENGKLPEKDAQYLDALTHTLKSIKTTMAMEGYGSSERRGRSSVTGRYISRDGSYDDGYGGSYDGSYRGERSMHGENPREHLQRMMDETNDERVKRALRMAMQNI